MHKILSKKVQLLGKCALCKSEESLCKCGDIQSIRKKEISKGLNPSKSKSTQLFVKQPTSLGRRITQTVGLTKRTKKSENWINLKTANIQGERIKNIGGAGYTPSEKKSVVVPSKGSGGLSKSILGVKKGGPGSGRRQGGGIKGLPTEAINYSHLLPASQKMRSYRLFAHHDPKTNQTHSFLTNRNRVVGQHAGSLGKLPTSGKPQYQVSHTKLAGGHNEGMSSALHTAALDHAISQNKIKKGGPGSGRKKGESSSLGQLPVSRKDYSHLLPASQVKAGARLLAGHDSNTGKTYSYLVNNGKLAGVHVGEMASGPKSKPQYKTLQTSSHNAGVTRALYNAGLHHATSQSK